MTAKNRRRRGQIVPRGEEGESREKEQLNSAAIMVNVQRHHDGNRHQEQKSDEPLPEGVVFRGRGDRGGADFQGGQGENDGIPEQKRPLMITDRKRRENSRRPPPRPAKEDILG